MRRNLLSLIAVLLAGISTRSFGQYGHLNVCNQLSDDLYVALVTMSKREMLTPWEGEGWMKVATGDCESVFAGTLTNRQFFLRLLAGGRIWFPSTPNRKVHIWFEPTDSVFCADPINPFDWVKLNTSWTISTTKVSCDAGQVHVYFPYVINTFDDEIDSIKITVPGETREWTSIDSSR